MTGVKRFFAWLWWIPILVVAAIVGEIPWIKRAGAWLDAHHDLGVAVTVGAAVAGFVLMMGGIIASMMDSGEPLSAGEIEDSMRRQRDAAARPYIWRRSKFRVKGASAGRGVEVETNLGAVKAAWRSGDWRRDPYWRRLFVTALGAALLTVGLFGIFIVVAPMPVKVLCAGAILYPAARIAMAFGRPDGPGHQE